MDEAEKKVLRSDEVVIEKTGLLLGENQYPASSVRESFEHGAKATAGAIASLPACGAVSTNIAPGGWFRRGSAVDATHLQGRSAKSTTHG